MKNLLALLIVLVLAAGALSTWLYMQLDAAQGSIAALEDEKAQLTSDLAAQKKEAETLLAEEAASVATLNEANAALSSEVDALKADCEAQLNEITVLMEQVSEIPALNEQIAALTAQVTELQAQNDAADADIAMLDEIKASLESENAALNEKLSALETYVNDAVDSLPLVLAEDNVEKLWEIFEQLQTMTH